MKVLAINGSARKNGNTDILISRIFDKLNAAGIDSESVRFEGNIIEPCKACFACGGKENCIHKKDQFAETFEKMKMQMILFLAHRFMSQTYRQICKPF